MHPHQVSKTTKSGEYIQRGSFIINGKRNILKSLPLELYVGIITKKKVIDEKEYETIEEFSGTKESCQKFCKKYVKVIYGKNSFKEINKQLKKKLGWNFENLPKIIPKNSAILKVSKK